MWGRGGAERQVNEHQPFRLVLATSLLAETLTNFLTNSTVVGRSETHLRGGSTSRKGNSGEHHAKRLVLYDGWYRQPRAETHQHSHQLVGSGRTSDASRGALGGRATGRRSREVGDRSRKTRLRKTKPARGFSVSLARTFVGVSPPADAGALTPPSFPQAETRWRPSGCALVRAFPGRAVKRLVLYQ